MLLKITLSSGLVGTQETQRRVVRALGLGKFGSCVFHADSPTIRGMVNKISHLLTVCEEEGQGLPVAEKEKSAKQPAKQATEAKPKAVAAKAPSAKAKATSAK